MDFSSLLRDLLDDGFGMLVGVGIPVLVGVDEADFDDFDAVFGIRVPIFEPFCPDFKSVLLDDFLRADDVP